MNWTDCNITWMDFTRLELNKPGILVELESGNHWLIGSSGDVDCVEDQVFVKRYVNVLTDEVKELV